MAKNGVNTTVDNILVVSGSQQALEFSAKLFVNKDDIIICEKGLVKCEGFSYRTLRCY